MRRELVRAQQVRTGDDAMRVDGPGGVWRLALHKNGRGYPSLSVTAPGVHDRLYSVDSVINVLVDVYGVPAGALDDDAPPPSPPAPPPPLVDLLLPTGPRAGHVRGGSRCGTAGCACAWRGAPSAIASTT